MNAREKIIGIVGLLVAILGAAAMVGMAFVMSATGAGGTHQRMAVEGIFLPSIAIYLEYLILKSCHNHGNIRPALWFAGPAILIALITIIVALTSGS